MNELPQAILAYWNTNLPSIPLYYEWAPLDAALPLAVFAATGFSREYQNGNLMLDTYRYEFTILSPQAESAYTTGFSAVAVLNQFDYTGLIQISPSPEAMATPNRAEPGFVTQWEYRFSIEFLLQPLTA